MSAWGIALGIQACLWTSAESATHCDMSDAHRIESRFQRYIWERTVSRGRCPGLPVNPAPLALNNTLISIQTRPVFGPLKGSREAVRIRFI
jgi:hypothetical protein